MHLLHSGRISSIPRFLALLLLFAFTIAGTASAAWISLGGPEGAGVEVRLLESSPDRIVVEYTLAGFGADPVQIDGNTYYRISLPGESSLLEAGMPELPHVARSVIVPDASRMEVHVIDADLQDFPGLPTAPSKGNLLRTQDPDQVPYALGAFYGSDTWFPREMADGSEPYILRDYRGMVIEALPFQAQGSDGTLRVARRLVVEAVATGPDVANVLHRSGPPTSIAEVFEPIYRRQFLNYGFDRYTPVGERGRLMIICYPDFMGAMQPLVDWKLQEGIPTELVDVSVIGNTTTAIKNAIQASYNAGGLAFVLLVGDGTQVVTQHAAGGASDPSYSLLAGTDKYPEILVGRFSAENLAQVQTQVARTISYEKTPMIGGAWYPKGVGIASNQGPGDDGEYDYQHVGNIRTKLLNYGYTFVDEIYDPTGTATMVTNALNQGRTIINYCGHGSQTSWGSTGFSNNNVNSLQNDNMLPFIFSVACVNGQFEGATCFAEAWLRATHNGNPTGAIATYMSSINQAWNPPMCAEDGADDLLVQDQKHTFGALCYNGSCQMMDEYGATNGGNEFLCWHVFGDPSLLVRTRTPEEMTVIHSGSFQIGEPTYAVTVTGVADALCSLYANGVLYGSAYTDGGGAVAIPVDDSLTDPTTLTLTVTGYNKIPVIEPVEAMPPTNANLVYEASSIDDTDGGDGDLLCDAGESIGLNVTLANSGTDPAAAVTADLSTSDPYVTIETGTAAFGDIPAGGAAAGLTPFRVVFAGNTPDEHVVTFSLSIHAQVGRWDASFPCTVGRPILGYVSHAMDDAQPLGNGSGWLGTGETADIALTIGNAGHANAVNLRGTLSPSPFVELVNGIGTCSDVAVGGQATMTPFRIRVRPECPSPYVLTLRVNLTGDYGFTGSAQFQLCVGGFLDDVEASRGWSLGGVDDDATSGAWIQADPIGTFEGGYPVQLEDDHTLTPGVKCFVTGNGDVGGAADQADVDGGKTTLYSPVFDLHAVDAASISYWVSYSNDRGDNPDSEIWSVQVSGNGTDWIDLENTNLSTGGWTQRTFDLQNYLTFTNQVQLRFVASETIPGSLVEAQVDDFRLVIVEPVADVEGPTAASDFALQGVSPNPVRGAAEIRFHAPVTSEVEIGIYDVSGRRIRSLVDGEISGGDHRVQWDRTNDAGRPVGAGVYFVRMRATGFAQVRQLALLD
jgi:hypothetical protein